MASRVETGAVQFGDDWPGVFIRGDNALMAFAPALRAILKGEDNELDRMLAENLVRILETCAVGNGEVRVLPAP